MFVRRNGREGHKPFDGKTLCMVDPLCSKVEEIVSFKELFGELSIAHRAGVEVY